MGHVSVSGVTVQMVQAKVHVAQDGVWGPMTEAAVRAFQKDNGLAVDGIVGPATWKAMEQSPPAPHRPPGHALEGVDYSFSGPMSGAQAKANGISFVCRYVSSPGNPKNLRHEEVADFKAHGIGIVVVFEGAETNAMGGRHQGVIDAQAADAQVKELGIAGCPIYFAVDFEPSQSQLPMVGEYLQGASATIGLHRAGVYGGYAVVEHALDNKLVTYAWQTLAWSGGNVHPHCHIYQYDCSTSDHKVVVAGVEVDRNRTVASSADYGQAGGPGAPNPT